MKEEIEELNGRINYLTEIIDTLAKDAEHPEHKIVVNVKDNSIGMYKTSLKSSIVGDLVGDPLKNAISPVLGLMVRFYSLVAFIFVPLFLSSSFLTKTK